MGPGQLARLNRIIALKDLGFTLEQVGAMLDQQVSAEQLRGMLRLRQAELQSQIAADTSRLSQVEARLRIIEMEGVMPADDIQVKRIRAVRVAQLTATAASLEPASISPVIQPLYEELGRRLGQAGWPPPPGGCFTRTSRTATACWCTPPCPSTPTLRAATTSRSSTCRDQRGGHDHPPRVHGQRHGDHPDAGQADREQRLPHPRVPRRSTSNARKTGISRSPIQEPIPPADPAGLSPPRQRGLRRPYLGRPRRRGHRGPGAPGDTPGWAVQLRGVPGQGPRRRPRRR